jgi:hypothetical protein
MKKGGHLLALLAKFGVQITLLVRHVVLILRILDLLKKMVNYIVKWILKNILLQDVQNVEKRLLEYVEIDLAFSFLTLN